MKLPAFQFYPGDWLKDPEVRSVSLAARGLWMDMLCLMHESDRRGYLQLSGKPVTADQLARMTGCSTDDVSRLLQELKDSGVYSCTEHGVIYNRRMVRDEKRRETNRENGRKGGNPNLKSDNRLPNRIPNRHANRDPTPSYSASTSASTSDERHTNPRACATAVRIVRDESEPHPDTGPIPPRVARRLYDLYPRKVAPDAAMPEIDAAVRRVQVERGCDVRAALTWLEGRVKAYGRSDAIQKGEARFVPNPARWFKEGRYNDDDAAWQIGTPKDDTETTPVPAAFRAAFGGDQ